VLPFGAAAFAQSESPVQAELRMERKLLSLDLVGYNESRERQQRARQGLDESWAVSTRR